jgi:hypothetical protein
MRMTTLVATIAGLAVLRTASVGRADTASVVAAADAFVDSAVPTGNFGGGGAIGVAAPDSPNGEFQSVLRFDLTSVLAQFDNSFGTGTWIATSASLKLSASAPVNGLFNPQAAGQFAVSWMANDTWEEGAGTPNQPGSTGITFATLPLFSGMGDETLGVFTFGGETAGDSTYELPLTPGFAARLGAGGPVSFRLSAADSTIAYLFHSRSFAPPYQPLLTITGAARCPADFDRSGSLGVQDIFDYLNAWFAGDARADFDGVGGLSVQDIFAFLNAWFAGCP